MVRDVVKMKDIQFEKGLFENWMTGKIMDELLCSYKGLPKGVNYMVIGDPGVGKTTIILDLLSDFSMYNSAKVLFVSAEMNEIDLDEVYVGSANLTGAGIGMKSAKTRNFEAGILTDESALLDAAIEQFDSVWAGFRCKDCSRKKFCGDPIIP